jgi:hypothetical protein
MIRLFQIMFVCFVMMLLVGCASKEKEADTKGIKIGELSPKGKRISPKVMHATNIEVMCYELPADNISSMENIWQVLNAGTLRYNEPNSFTANGLRAAMGKFSEYQKVTAMITAANAKKQPTTSLLMGDNQPELLGITRIPNKTSISYIGRQGVIKQTDAGPGNAGLQIFTRQIVDLSAPRGAETSQMVSINVVPAILASTEGAAPAIADRIRENDLRIYSAGFSAIIKPGEFIMLGPAEYKQDEATATGRFFTKQGPKPAIRFFLLVCVSIF